MLAEKLGIDRFGEIFPHLEDILHCGLYYHSPDRSVNYWSPGMYSLIGVSPDAVECVPESFGKYVLPEDRERVLEQVKKAALQSGTYQLDFSILDQQGIYKRVHTRTSVKTGTDGRVTEFSGVMRDITENYFYRQALEQKVAQLDKSNRNLQEFVYVASHDLQEPLRKITTFAERLRTRSGEGLGDEGNMYVARILNSCNNMQVLLEDLLSFSRLSSQEKELTRVSLDDCLAGALADLEIKMEETGAVVEADALPETEGYPSQLRQLFINLIGNAIKFRKPSVPPHIVVRCAETTGPANGADTLARGRYHKITVQDNGIGFEQEFAEKIFMIFQRLNSRAEFAGSGVGLAICKRIVENHHGLIYANSSPGDGAMFTVLLPVKQL